MEEKEIGKITHYFGKIGVCVIKLSEDLKKGDTIHVKGATTDFQQQVDSMQVNHKDIEEAKPEDSVGLKSLEPVREHDIVYKLIQ
ncbi:MAG: translation elongation factor-like protein [Candidatus Woesearchaeota archaeon]